MRRIRPANPRAREDWHHAPRITNARQGCLMGMSPLIGRRGDRRVIQWGRVFGRAVVVVLAALILFLLAACVLVASTEVPLSQMWWGDHLFVLLLAFLALAVLVCVGVPLLRRLLLPPDRLPDLDAPRGGERSESGADRPKAWGGLVVVVAVAAFAVLVAILYLEENERGERVWTQYKQQQEARGEHLDPAALVPPLVPDDENFASTPFLAPLFDFLPGTQQRRDPNAPEPTKTLAPQFDAATARLRPDKVARSNSWISAGIDLPAWYIAFLKGTNATESEDEATKAFRKRYGLVPRETAATAVQPPTINPPVPTNAPTRAEAAAGVLDALAESGPILEELRAASLRPHSRFNLRYDVDDPASILLPHLSTLKHVCQVLQLRASAELALGRTDQAFEDVNLIFRVTDATRDEPILISHLVRIGELQLGLQPLAGGLARHQWSEPQLRAFEERLHRFDFLADARQALQGERVFFGGAFIDYVRRSPHRWRLLEEFSHLTAEDHDAQYTWRSALLAAAPRGWYYLEKVNYSRMFQDYFLPAIDVPGHRVSPDACRRSEEHLAAILNNPAPVVVLRHQFFSGFLLPALSRAAQRSAFGQTGADTAALACALERYRLAHGQFPESLDALMPEIVSRLPHDVINGQPLKYRRTADGQYLLYSVGWNETDDGGVLGLTESGEGIDQKMGDWVWRLPAR